MINVQLTAHETKPTPIAGSNREDQRSTLMQPSVYITFDVECSMGGAWGNPKLKPVPPERAIWGEYGGQKLGLPLIVSILEQNGLRGTFFVDAFTVEQGFPGAMEPVCEFLLNSGQDVQLHVHPNKKHFAMKMRGEAHPKTDYIADLDSGAQLALLQEGSDRILAWSGRRPIAFRAGNMGASEETLRQLSEAEIPIDSSYTFPYAGGQCRFRNADLYNGSRWYGKTLELALSGFRQPAYPGLQAAKPLDLVGISFQECRDAMKLICKGGADAVLILHSFSLFKWRNSQYDGGRLNSIVARRFRNTCRWLAENAAEFPCRTFSDVASALTAGQYQARSAPPCLVNNPVRSYLRKGVQAWNHFYRT